MEAEEIATISYLRDDFSGDSNQRTISASIPTKEVSRTWYDAAMRELHLANFLSKPSLATVQTLAILALLHKNLGELDREYFLLGLSINIARTLGMDRLGREDSFSAGLSSHVDWSDRQNRELGRRLWWTLLISDWYLFHSLIPSFKLESWS